MSSVAFRAWTGLVAVAIAMFLLLFISAGTLRYWQAWLYLAVFFAIAGLMTGWLRRSHPPAPPNSVFSESRIW
jgi:hypothetical protein